MHTEPFLPRGDVEPIDSAAALAVSTRLGALIAREIDAAGGWLPFARYMELALYAPGLGYYSAGAMKVGHEVSGGSDFVTAPELTPLFARALARPVAEVLRDGARTIVELGGGSGRLATDLLLELESLDALPAEYLLLDVSADFRQRQVATLASDAPHLVERVRWIDALPDRIEGVVLGNEVLDALPVDLVVRDGSGWLARGVERDRQGFRFADRPATADVAAAAIDAVPDATRLSPGYLTEVHRAMAALVATLASRLDENSVILLIDYGFPASEYYHQQRSGGTLIAHRRHRTSLDILAMPGLQDITSHVNFSAVAEAARRGAALTVGYASQASFLIDCGIADLLIGGAADARAWAPQAAALQTLLSEAEMGELFKVIALATRPRVLTGFGGSDRRGAL